MIRFTTHEFLSHWLCAGPTLALTEAGPGLLSQFFDLSFGTKPACALTHISRSLLFLQSNLNSDILALVALSGSVESLTAFGNGVMRAKTKAASGLSTPRNKSR
jgi:hypothetical protein